MSVAVSDTHAVAWYLEDKPDLSAPARAVFDRAEAAGETIAVPSICLVELQYLVEKRRFPQLALDLLEQRLREPDGLFVVVPLDLEIALTLRQISRSTVPDMPDRIIAATALALSLPLVSRDGRIRAAQVQTIW